MKRIWPTTTIKGLCLGGIVVMMSLTGLIWQHPNGPAPPVQGLAGQIAYVQTANPAKQIEPSPTSTPLPVLTQAKIEPMDRARVIAAPALSDIEPVPVRASDTPTVPPTDVPSTRPSPTLRPPVAPLKPAGDPPVRIVAPAIQLDVEVVSVGWNKVLQNGRQTSEWVVPKDAAGWHFNSAPPGQAGNTVISGHNNVEGEVFRYVPELKIGDTITVYAGGETYDYTVQEKHLVKEAGEPESVRKKNAEWIAATDDVRLTLVTCWPYSWPGNTHRLIVVARP